MLSNWVTLFLQLRRGWAVPSPVPSTEATHTDPWLHTCCTNIRACAQIPPQQRKRPDKATPVPVNCGRQRQEDSGLQAANAAEVSVGGSVIRE